MSVHDILKQPIETDLLEHYIKYITMVQDWERIMIWNLQKKEEQKAAFLKYCYIRKEGNKKWVRCPDSPDEKNSYDIKKCKVCKSSNGGGKETSYFDNLKNWIIEDENKHLSSSSDEADFPIKNSKRKVFSETIFTKRLIPELDEKEESEYKDIRLIFEYPPYTIFPKSESTSHKLGLYYERQQIEILRQLAMKRKVILETKKHGSKTAMTAIIARNLSHNIGSHVLSRWIVALNELLKKEDEIEDGMNAFVPTENNTDIEEYMALFQMIKEFIQKLKDSKPLFQYIQHRMDFIATVATSIPSSEMTMDFKKDVLNPFTDKERNKVILENIAASEGFNNIIFEENDIKLPENCKRVSIPNGIIGTHAIYSILENFIRNAAKHYKGKEKGNGLKIGIELKIPDRIRLNNNPKNRRRISNNNVEFNANVLTIKGENGQTCMLTKSEQKEIKGLFDNGEDKEMLERFFYVHERYIKLRIWDMRDGSCNAEILEKLRKFLDRKGEKGRLIDEEGMINPDGWGIKEMVVSSNFLRKNSPEKLIGDLGKNEPSILEIMCSDDSDGIACKKNGENCHRADDTYKDRLGIRLYLRRPKDMCIIGEKEVTIEKDKFEIEYSNAIKQKGTLLTEDIPHRLLFVNESSKEYYEDDPMAPMRIMTYKNNVNNGKNVNDKFYLERYDEFIKELGGFEKLPILRYGGGGVTNNDFFQNINNDLSEYLNSNPYEPLEYQSDENGSFPYFYYHANEEGASDTVGELIQQNKYFQPISGKYTSIKNKLETLPEDIQYQKHFLFELIESFPTKVLIIDERVSDLADKDAFHGKTVRNILRNMKIDCLKVDKDDITYDSIEVKLREIDAINSQRNCIGVRKLSDYKYHFLVIHQGILDKVKKSNGNPNDLVKNIDYRWMVIDSGRGVPKELEEYEDARFVETSALLKMLEEYDKHGLVQTLFSLRRPFIVKNKED